MFESSQNPIVVGQAAYNSAYGTNFAPSGYCSAPDNPSAKCDGYARINQQGGMQLQVRHPRGCPAAAWSCSSPIQPKGIHDEMNSANFDEFGRMSANMGLEAPGATPLTQNIILYPFNNPSTENLDATGAGAPNSLDVTPISVNTDGTQIWKITHNGVDTHPIHFHLYDIQVLNRVTWDNIIIPPSERARMEGHRPGQPARRHHRRGAPGQADHPVRVPDSMRPLNPMMPIGARGNQNGPNGIRPGSTTPTPRATPSPRSSTRSSTSTGSTCGTATSSVTKRWT